MNYPYAAFNMYGDCVKSGDSYEDLFDAMLDEGYREGEFFIVRVSA